MRELRVAVAQFEARDGDKQRNLDRVRALALEAAGRGAMLACFHECCIPGYTHLMTLSRHELLALAEPVPGGPSVERLQAIARRAGLVVGAGLVEREGDALYNTYAIVASDGFVAKARKLHPFVSPHLQPGEGPPAVFDLLGCRMAVLVCYDNNLPENVRRVALEGAEVVLMPHVTGGLPSVMPGRGTIDRGLWDARERDPVSLRQEFHGPKGRGWLLRWLPCRAWENGVYVLFTNTVGVDHDTVKPGGSMVLDPYGEIIAEVTELGDGMATALLTPEKLANAPGRRYLRARRPELYQPLVAPPPPGEEPVTRPGWRLERPADAPASEGSEARDDEAAAADEDSGGRAPRTGGR